MLLDNDRGAPLRHRPPRLIFPALIKKNRGGAEDAEEGLPKHTNMTLRAKTLHGTLHARKVVLSVCQNSFRFLARTVV